MFMVTKEWTGNPLEWGVDLIAHEMESVGAINELSFNLSICNPFHGSNTQSPSNLIQISV